jgi:hypothetical protein
MLPNQETGEGCEGSGVYVPFMGFEMKRYEEYIAKVNQQKNRKRRRRKDMILGFDIDGVIYPWHEEAWKWFNRKLPNDEHISFIDFWKYPEGFVAKNEGTEIIKQMVADTFTYVRRRPDPVMVDTIQYIADNIVDEIYYITSRPHTTSFDTRIWLKHGEFPFHENLIMADKNGGKVNTVKEVGCDYYVEDRPKYLEQLPAVTKVFQMIRPYNLYKIFDAIRIGNFIELVAHLKWENMNDNL